MRLLLVAVRLFVLSILFAPQLIVDARAADSAAAAKCIDIPDGLGSEDLIALCTSVIETEKDLPADRLARALHARGVGYWRKKEFDKAIADYEKALEVLPAGSDENFRQILLLQRNTSVDNKKAEADAAAAKSDNWPMFLVCVAGVCGIWAASFRTRIGAVAYGTAGRISRSDYWLAFLAVFAVAAVQYLALVAAKRMGVSQLGPVAGPMFFVGWMATILLAATAVSIKRLHDRNRAAWTLIVPVAAVLGALLAGGSLLAEPSDGGPFSGRWKQVFDGSFATGFGGVTPAGPILIAALLSESLGMIGGRGVNLVLALGHLLALAMSLWYLREVGFLRGTVGANSYGPDPLGSAPAGQASISKARPRMSPQVRRYAAVAVGVTALAAGLYAFAPWRLLSHGPDQASIEANADETCRWASNEMSKDLGLSPNRKNAADIAIRACTIVIRDDSRAAIRADSYLIRGRAHEALAQKENAIADYKEADKVKPHGGAACALFHMGVAGYECLIDPGGAPLPEFH